MMLEICRGTVGQERWEMEMVSRMNLLNGHIRRFLHPDPLRGHEDQFRDLRDRVHGNPEREDGTSVAFWRRQLDSIYRRRRRNDG